MIEQTILDLGRCGLGPEFLKIRERLMVEIREAKRRPDAASIRADLCLRSLRLVRGSVGLSRFIGAVEIACTLWDEGGGQDDTGSVG
jgi:hypothetical protein